MFVLMQAGVYAGLVPSHRTHVCLISIFRGKKAFTGYLGEDQSSWAQWDATELVQSYTGPPLDILIDQVGGVLHGLFA
jgi:S-formylglutathione hydrolase FrmB